MSSNRSETINEIISSRHPLGEQIDKVLKNLGKLKDSLLSLEGCRQELLSLNTPGFPQELLEVHFDSKSEIIERINREIKALEKLKPRFLRKTLNIAVLGNAGKGKSTLLEKLAGLPEGVIPRSSKGHCTSVAFSIVNGTDDSTIYFHTEESFLKNVIHIYYRELDLGKEPETLAEFKKFLPPFNSEQTTARGKYDYLKSYHEHLDSYEKLLGQKELKIPVEEILKVREYVAHTDIESRPIYKSMAVRKAEIVYEFPDSDVGKIALVDTPGLDDTGVGHIQKLTEILENEIDITLLVWLPEVQRGSFRKEDYELYEVAKDALGKRLPLKRWSFFILNQLDSTKGDNRDNCEYIANNLKNTPIEVIGNPIIVNCLDPQSAKAEVLDKVLEYLCKEIRILDRDYCQFCQSAIDDIQKEVEAILGRLDNLFRETDRISNKEFRKLFKGFWSSLFPELEKLVIFLRNESINSQNNIFQSQVEEAVQACLDDTAIPDLELIEKIRLEKARGNYTDTYSICLDKMRTNLSKKFARIDVGLKDLVEDIKTQVAEVLINFGSLGGLTESRGSAFIKYMAETIPDEYKNLKEGFEILSDFELSYRGLFQPRIRKHLNPIIPDKTEIKLPINPKAEDIIRRLEQLHEGVLYECEKAMQGMIEEPNLATSAIVEEFFEQVFAADDVKDDWENFLEEHQEQVWFSRFNSEPQIKSLQEEWSRLIKESLLANQVDSLNFL